MHGDTFLTSKTKGVKTLSSGAAPTGGRSEAFCLCGVGSTENSELGGLQQALGFSLGSKPRGCQVSLLCLLHSMSIIYILSFPGSCSNLSLLLDLLLWFVIENPPSLQKLACQASLQILSGKSLLEKTPLALSC